jgi:hypothetical protein
MLLGALLARTRRGAGERGVSVASGLIAGEGITAVVLALWAASSL